MNERHTVIGFTEAELGFFLVFLLLAIGIAMAPTGGEDPEGPAPRDSLILAISARDSLAAILDSLNVNRFKPDCDDPTIGLASFPVPDILTVITASRFTVASDTRSLSEFGQEVEPLTAQAILRECYHRVRVRHARTLSADEMTDFANGLLGYRFRVRTVR